MTKTAIISGLLGVVFWVLCVMDWTSGACKAGLLAWFLKWPAIVATIIFVICLAVKAFRK